MAGNNCTLKLGKDESKEHTETQRAQRKYQDWFSLCVLCVSVDSVVLSFAELGHRRFFSLNSLQECRALF